MQIVPGLPVLSDAGVRVTEMAKKNRRAKLAPRVKKISQVPRAKMALVPA